MVSSFQKETNEELLSQKRVENEIVSSNLSENAQLSNIERLRRGLKPTTAKNNEKIPGLNRDLTYNERREIYNLTFKLGNLLFLSKEDSVIEDFKHSYSLRYIQLDSDDVQKIGVYLNYSVFN